MWDPRFSRGLQGLGGVSFVVSVGGFGGAGFGRPSIHRVDGGLSVGCLGLLGGMGTYW